MLTPDALPSIRGLIRETVADPSAWSHCLEHLSRATRSDGAWLVRETDRTPDAPRTESVGDTLDEYFAQGWSGIDERIARCVPRFKAGQPIVSDLDVLNEDDRRRSQFHQDFALRHDYPFFTAASFAADETLWAISFLRHGKTGAFSRDDRLGMATLLGDLASAATVSALLGRNTLTTLGRALDLNDRPVVALDARGTVVHANQPFEREKPSFGEDLVIRGGDRLVARDRASHMALHAAIGMASGPSARGRRDVGTLAIQRRQGLPIMAKAIPVAAISENPFSAAKLILVFSTAEPVAFVTAERIRDVLKVTLAESRLLNRLRLGETVTQAAEALGVAKATARTQLKAVYGKLDVHSQRELIQILQRL